jgi:uroporphyrinogen-III synthase
MVERPCVITRSHPGAEHTAAAVAALGWTPVLCPARAVIPVAASAADLDQGRGAGAVLLTSAHAARLAPPELHGLPALAVGAATAFAASTAGFADVASADGDVIALARQAADRFAGTGQSLLHVRGLEVTGDLAGELAKAGIEVLPLVVYSMGPSRDFHDRLDAASRRRVGAVLFHNPQAARDFAEAPCVMAFTGWEAVAISQAAFDPVDEACVWGEVFIATAPHETAMLAALGPARAA